MYSAVPTVAGIRLTLRPLSRLVNCSQHMGSPSFWRGRVGLMGMLADAALAGGGRVVGVIPKVIEDLEVAHRCLSELHIVESMHERKALMADLAEAFIALPGGFGTLDELCEILTWAQLGMHRKPVGLLNIDGYYDLLLAFLDRSTADGFVHPAHRQLLIEGTDPVGSCMSSVAARLQASKSGRMSQA